MKQIWIRKAGEPEVLEMAEAIDPTPASGEVRIRVEACGVNFADIVGRMGMYGAAPGIPYIPGFEVAGAIDKVGQGVPDLREGDNVLAVTEFGGYSDVVCVPQRQVFPRWDWMSAEHGAALPVNYLTAYMALLVMGSLHSDDKVLVHNVAGGVGLAALDICRIKGAQTYGTASPEKHDFLVGKGLDYPIDYRNRDYEQVVYELTDGNGVQLILDPLGGKHWRKNYRLLTPGGRLVHFGFSSAVTGKSRSWFSLLKTLLQVPFYTPIRLMQDNKAVIGIHLGRLWSHVDMQRRWMTQILNWYDEALFRPHVDKCFRFSEAAAAHHFIQDRKNVGKVLLIP